MRINFRQKDEGWNLFALSIQYIDNAYKCFHGMDPYMKAFLSNKDLRPSCYQCHSKSLHRHSDITLADFWGIDNIEPAMNDNKGTSLVFVNSDKGMKLFNSINDKIVFKKVDLNEAVKYNSAAYQSVERPKDRENFLNEIESMDFIKCVDKYTRVSWKVRVKNKLKSILKGILNGLGILDKVKGFLNRNNKYE